MRLESHRHHLRTRLALISRTAANPLYLSSHLSADGALDIIGLPPYQTFASARGQFLPPPLLLV